MLGEGYFCLQGRCKLQKNWQEDKVVFLHDTMFVTCQLLLSENLDYKSICLYIFYWSIYAEENIMDKQDLVLESQGSLGLQDFRRIPIGFFPMQHSFHKNEGTRFLRIFSIMLDHMKTRRNRSGDGIPIIYLFLFTCFEKIVNRMSPFKLCCSIF